MRTPSELKALMALAGINQQNLAEELDCRQQVVANAIKGASNLAIKRKQITDLLEDRVKEKGYQIVKVA